MGGIFEKISVKVFFKGKKYLKNTTKLMDIVQFCPLKNLTISF
jgi:hypothetical protein